MYGRFAVSVVPPQRSLAAHIDLGRLACEVIAVIRRLGNYELLCKVASGGVAHVFLVRDEDRILALKVLHPNMMADEDVLRMFMSEAKIASQLRHPNIVAIGGFGEADGIHCLSMEYIFGVNLADALLDGARAGKPLSVGALLSIVASVCDGLEYAHQMTSADGQALGIVHRDVTPHNILIGFNGTPKLADFGIAKAVNRGWETTVGVVKGKFCYMSPEQALGKITDPRSDVFSLGIVLWEALTGRELFTGNSPLQIFTAIRESPIAPPSRVSPGLSSVVDEVVLKALRRGLTMRFQSAGEMARAIRDLLASVNLVITPKKISQELGAIYGELIAKRALALRQAMTDQLNISNLCEAMGAQRVQDSHLPAPPTAEDQDPFGFLDADLTAMVPTITTSKTMPARPEVELSGVYNVDDLDWDDMEATVVQRPAPAALQELQLLEPEVDDFDIDIDESELHEWDGGNESSLGTDALLSMISDENLDNNEIPSEFTGQFGEDFVQTLRRNSSITLGSIKAELESVATVPESDQDDQ
jgi:serine/threonine protein kinase